MHVRRIFSGQDPLDNYQLKCVFIVLRVLTEVGFSSVSRKRDSELEQKQKLWIYAYHRLWFSRANQLLYSKMNHQNIIGKRITDWQALLDHISVLQG